MKLNARDAARLLAMSESELYRLVDDGQVPCHTVNRQPVFSHTELLEWATQQRRPVAVELFAELHGHAADLAPAIASGGVHHDVGGTDRSSVLREIAAHLPITEDDRAMVLALLLAREAEVSSGVGRGIAIPHVRAPLVFSDRAAAIAVCYLATPVQLDAIDGKPVHTIFAMITPTIDIHLQLLSRLGLALHDGGFTAAIERRADATAIVEQARRIDAGVAARATAT